MSGHERKALELSVTAAHAGVCVTLDGMPQFLLALARLGALTLGLVVAAAFAQSPQEPRFALVVGNGAYKTGALQTPAQDAKGMAEALRAFGFKVIEVIDGGKNEMQTALLQAGDAMRGGLTIGMFYYAGHALQFGQRNYLIPVDARLSGAGDVLANTLDVQGVLEVFERAGNRTNVFVFDSSRENPFSASASARGLAQMEAPPGSFLAFAAAPGEVADDANPGSGHGLYTHHLLAELKRPGAKIEDLFKRVRFQVRKHSQGRQLPWESTSLEDDFHFDTAVTRTRGAAPAERPASEAAGVADTAGVADAAAAHRLKPEFSTTEFFAGSTRFVGNFKADPKGLSYSGNGKVFWADGSSFEGTLAAGKREGHGKYVWGNGQRYEGLWLDNRPSGPGMHWFANGDVYEGTVENGEPNGQGRMRFASGDRYVGEFKSGRVNGRGAYTWASGQTLVGLWVDGRVEGDASLRFVNGDVFEGEVAQGRPEGRGRMAFRSGDVYTGRFKGGQPEGEGSYAWANGDRFVGYWMQGRREGVGVMTLRNGDRWEGHYRADAQADGQWIAAAK